PLDDEHRSLYCSAFVAKCYKAAGYVFSTEYAIDNISPQILYNGLENYKSEIAIYPLSIRNQLVF
ncbi:hypothetical protein, partial [Desulfurella sp.]|uniref:hypothetical protein n=1 Tax=Desulfurella sp. TaxID=1962857 RepID=UPI0025BA0096